MKNLLLLSSLLFFIGCQKPPAELQHMTNKTSVGVVSAGLSGMRVQTALGRARYVQVDISDMNLDRIFEEKLIKKLSTTKMNPKRVTAYGDKTIIYSKTMDEFEYEFRSFWTGLYYYARQMRWEQKHKNSTNPLYALKHDDNKKAIFKTNNLKYLISVIEPYIYNQGLQSQIRIGYPLIGEPYIIFEPMVPMQKIKEDEVAFVTRLDKKGYFQMENYNSSPWKNKGKLHLTPKIKQEIKAILLRQMDKVVDDVYGNIVKHQNVIYLRN